MFSTPFYLIIDTFYSHAYTEYIYSSWFCDLSDNRATICSVLY